MKPKPLPTISALLRAHRARAGLSQPALAARAGVPVGTLRNLEQGIRTNPEWETVQRLAAALGCATDDLRTLPS